MATAEEAAARAKLMQVGDPIATPVRARLTNGEGSGASSGSPVRRTKPFREMPRQKTPPKPKATPQTRRPLLLFILAVLAIVAIAAGHGYVRRVAAPGVEPRRGSGRRAAGAVRPASSAGRTAAASVGRRAGSSSARSCAFGVALENGALVLCPLAVGCAALSAVAVVASGGWLSRGGAGT